MSGSHEKLPKFFWVQLIAAAFIGILWLFAPNEGGKDEAKVDPTMAAALKPIGTVALAKPAEEADAPRSGKDIVAKNCNVCHSIGLAGAPKLDASAKADWEKRLAGGYDAVVASAIKGKGGMPPRGGDATLSDDEISEAIKNMLETVGVEVAEASEAPKADATESEPAKEVAAADVTKEATPAAPAKEVVAAVATKSAATVVKEEVKPAAAVEAKKEAKAAAEPVVVAATELGESTYKSSCFACHDSGVANSPKFGDKAVWAPRIAHGIAALHTAAIKGKGAMPGKGGNPSLSDQAVREAVNYMIVNSQ